MRASFPAHVGVYNRFMGDIELQPLLRRVPQLSINQSRDLVKQQAIQDTIKYAGPPLLTAVTGPSGTGLFRNFVYAHQRLSVTLLVWHVIERVAQRYNVTVVELFVNVMEGGFIGIDYVVKKLSPNMMEQIYHS